MMPLSSKSWRQHLFFWLAYFALSFCLWLLLVNTTRAHELWMAGFASLFGATAAERVRSQRFSSFRPRLFWIVQAWREPWYIVSATLSLLWLLLLRLFRPEPSILREMVFDAGGTDPASTARRALAVTYTNLSPDFVVLGIDGHKNVLLVHQLSESKTPILLRNLGAKS